jgi:hypothetical protein
VHIIYLFLKLKNANSHEEQAGRENKKQPARDGNKTDFEFINKRVGRIE